MKRNVIMFPVGIITIFVIAVPVLSSLDVRLMDDRDDKFSGRVEVRLDGVWGTVCDDGWDLRDAQVVCRMLGFGDALRADGYALYGEGTGDIFLSDVDCYGFESNLDECRHKSFGEHNCHHAEDAGVQCIPEDFQVRLSGGPNAREGRVEVFYDGSWGTVCAGLWGLQDARVVCRMLGYQSASSALIGDVYGQGQGSIILANVLCSGSEDSLIKCPFQGLTYDIYCKEDQVAGAICSNEDFTPVVAQVRLADGYTRMEGRVEVSFGGSWGTICDDQWNLDDARVVCRMLGFSSALSVTWGARYGEGSGDILLDNVGCLGIEENLAECSHNGIGISNCDHSEDAGVVCSENSITDVRLLNGRSTWEGRVEVLYNHTWGTVCGDGWTLREADVVCKELGFTGASYALQNAAFGEGGGQIFIGRIECHGTESRLNECSYTTLPATSSCSHSMDPGVMCKVPLSSPLELRLIDGQHRFSGRVEVHHDGVWGTVCDDGWDLKDAQVVCRMLGFGDALRADGYAEYGQGRGTIFLDEVDCNGYESNLERCRHDGFEEHDCQHTEDAGVLCSPQDFQVRLVDGPSPAEGRVEVFIEGSWGTICDDYWGLEDALVVCRMLGYRSASGAPIEAAYGEGLGPITLADVECTGTEYSLLACAFMGFGVNGYCGHHEDAGVICSDEENTPATLIAPNLVHVSLEDGRTQMEGRVEVLYRGAWGTICGGDWDIDDAMVVCKMLGYQTALRALGGEWFGQGMFHAVVDDLACVGTEDNLMECGHSEFEIKDCGDYGVAGVICGGNRIRLAGGRSPGEGRVEVMYNQTWGTVCGDVWTLREADVVCRELGFTGASSALRNAAFGEGEGKVLLEGISCRGDERSLKECSYTNLEANSTCSHNMDAGVMCKGTKTNLSLSWELRDISLETTSENPPSFDSTLQHTTMDSPSGLSEDTKPTFSPALASLGAILFVSYVIFVLVGIYLCHHTKHLEKMLRIRQAEQPAMCALLKTNALPNATSETTIRKDQASDYEEINLRDHDDSPL